MATCKEIQNYIEEKYDLVLKSCMIAKNQRRIKSDKRELIKLLRGHLNEINRTLNDLFILAENNNENQEEINCLAQDIYWELFKGNKIDWKAIAKDKSIDLVIAAIPIIL